MNRTEAAVLALLAPGDLSGRELRQRLHDQGVKFPSTPDFYMFMANMESSGLVTGYEINKTVEEVPITERWYRH